MKILAKFFKISAAVVMTAALALFCTSSSVADTIRKSGSTAKVDDILDEDNILSSNGLIVTSVKEFTPAKTVNVANGNFLNGNDFTGDDHNDDGIPTDLASPYVCASCGAWFDILGPNNIEYVYANNTFTYHYNLYHTIFDMSFVHDEYGLTHSTQIHYKEKLYEVTVNYYKP